MSDLKPQELLRVWAACGMTLTLTPGQLRRLAAMFERSEEDDWRALDMLDRATQRLKLAIALVVMAFVILLASVVLVVLS